MFVTSFSHLWLWQFATHWKSLWQVIICHVSKVLIWSLHCKTVKSKSEPVSELFRSVRICPSYTWFVIHIWSGRKPEAWTSISMLMIKRFLKNVDILLTKYLESKIPDYCKRQSMSFIVLLMSKDVTVLNIVPQHFLGLPDLTNNKRSPV